MWGFWGFVLGFFYVVEVGPRSCGGGLGFWAMVFDFFGGVGVRARGSGGFFVVEEVLGCLFLLYDCFSFDCAPTVRWPSRGLGC